jgi:hypothetical protein
MLAVAFGKRVDYAFTKGGKIDRSRAARAIAEFADRRISRQVAFSRKKEQPSGP